MLQALTPFIAIIAAVLIRTDRRIVQELKTAQATSADTAVILDTSHIRGLRINRLTKLGCLHSLGDNRYYLDEGGWERWRSIRRRRVLTVIVAAVALVVLVIIFNQQ